MKLSPARTAAYDILFKIETERAYSSTLLARYEPELGPADRGLCHEIVLGVLRRKLLLDRYIDTFTKNKRLDIEIRVILQIGLFQLYYLDRVPDHAVVNEGVGLVQRAKKSSARGLVNAVLRAAAKQKPELSFNSEVERIATETSHPEWLVDHWQSQHMGGSVEELALSNNETPQIVFRKTVNGLGLNFDEKYIESTLVPGCFISNSFSADLKQFADEGKIYFQDEASQMVAASIDLKPRDKFLDVCASPGGKTTYIAYRMGGEPDALLVAGDISTRRVKLLQETCNKQHADFVNVVRYNAAVGLPFADGSFDRLLVDAPCTGTGTIRHNPEIRYLIEPEDFLRMQKTQLSILFNAANLVKNRGTLIYTTCSLEREENEDVCHAFLSNVSDWTPVHPKVPERFLNRDGVARTYPDRDGLDGFFIATFQRT